ncbi:MAG: DMT family transporter, partial [Alphaproteobacteria bacterium]|nr:DMT family transporter [Alphaproteobacteria bacterium]
MSAPTQSSSPAGSAGLAYLLLVLCTVFWGGNMVVGRAAVAEVPPFGLAFWRNLIALAVLLPLTWRDVLTLWPMLWRNAPVLLGLGVVGTAMFNSVMYMGLHTTPAINGALFMSLTPVAVPIFSLMLIGERLTRWQAAGILVSLIGVGIILARGDWQVVAAFEFRTGDWLVITAMLCWAYYSVHARQRPPEMSPYAFLTVILAVATVALIPFYAWETASGKPMPVTMGSILAAGYVGIFPTAVALILFNRAVAIIGPNRTGPFNHLVPVVATILAVIFLGERLQPYHFAGVVA